MGAVTFSLDVRLIQCIKESLTASTFIETGTFKGDTVQTVLPYFDRLISIECSESLYGDAVARFEGDLRVQLVHGNSPDVLKGLCSTIQGEPAIFWLDAHWCMAEKTGGYLSQCPLIEEIAAIGVLDRDSVVLIDDARLFLAPPPEPHEASQWPSLDEVIKALYRSSERHELMVINDVLVFYPRAIRSALISYARKVGVDWLMAFHALVENGELQSRLEKKELEYKSAVNGLRQLELELDGRRMELKELRQELVDKEAVIRLLSRSLSTSLSPGILRRMNLHRMRFMAWVRAIFSPRLGRLVQHAPRDWIPPSPYTVTNASNLPKISIVTPSFRQGGFIERTIKSVLDQGYENLEYYVQDGGSEDGTVDILQRYGDRLSGWVSQPDGGQTQAINQGLSKCTGDILAWLNSDDLLLPGALAYVGEYFAMHPEVDVVYGHRILIDEDEKQIGRWMLPPHQNDVLSWSDYIPQETVFWRRSIWEKVGGQLDESFRFAMDWDLLVRFRCAGARFARLPRFLGAFRIHNCQKTSVEISGVGSQEMACIRERMLGRLPSDTEIYQAILPYLRRHILTDLWWRISSRLGMQH